jgi:PPOX class probable F420-dependent enzyme
MGQDITYTEEMHELLRKSLYGMLTVLRPDGMPSTNPVSYTWDGELVRISTLKSRYKYKSLLKNQRVAFCVQSATNPMAYIEIRGQASLEDDPERSVLRTCFQEAGLGEPPGDLDPPNEERAAIVIKPQRISSPKLYGGRFDK